MINIEDFETIYSFNEFIVKYLCRKKILKVFQNDLKYHHLDYRCRTLSDYINDFYIKKRNLTNFFTYSFSWNSTFEGEDFWYNIFLDFKEYLKENTINNTCWSD